jgi:outer membrane protein TolC
MAGLAASARAQDAPQGLQPARTISLEEALALAAANAVSIRARTAQLASASAAERSARAAYLPKVTTGLSGAYLANPPSGITVKKGSLATVPFSIPSQDLTIVEDAKNSYFKGNITLSQPIVAWGKIRASVDLARLEVEASLAARDGALRDTMRDTSRAYFAARLALDSAAVLRELRALAAQVAADRAASAAEGLATRADVLSAEADLAQVDARVVEAVEGAAAALLGLKALTGLPDSAAIELSTSYRDSLPALDEVALLAEAVDSSTDRLVAATRLAEAGRKVDLERGSALFLPDLAFFASLDASGQTPPLSAEGWMDSTWSWDLTLGISVSANLYDGGRSAAKLAAATSDKDAAAAALKGAADSVRIAARQALQAAREAAAGLDRARAKAAWTAEVLKNARLSAEGGLLSRTDLNRAAIQDAAARLDLISARYALEEARADLERLAPVAMGVTK